MTMNCLYSTTESKHAIENGTEVSLYVHRFDSIVIITKRIVSVINYLVTTSASYYQKTSHSYKSHMETSIFHEK